MENLKIEFFQHNDAFFTFQQYGPPYKRIVFFCRIVRGAPPVNILYFNFISK
jgi:hypothetical protein